MSNPTEELIDDLFRMARGDLPEPAVLQAKRCMLDYLGVTLAGARMLEKKGHRLLDCLGSSARDATAVGLGRRTTMANAALVNGLSAHIAELDDGHRVAMMHPGAVVISALLPIAEYERLEGNALISGIVIGYEAALRIAAAMQPSLKARGYHATGVGGALGAAVGIAAALGFTKLQMKDALSAAATGAAGLLGVIEGASELKPYNAGHAALNGVSAALVARAGFRGPDDVLSGANGLIPTMADKYDLSCLRRMHDGEYAIERVYLKPYAACRHCHPAIEAALRIRASAGLDPDRIADVTVTSYQWAVHLHDHTDIRGVTSAKMSTPYSVAVALLTGKADISAFTPDCIGDSHIRSFAQRVDVRCDEELSALVPYRRPAIVEIRTDDNRSYIDRVDLPKGEPENPMSDREIEEKFLSLSVYSNISQRRANEIIDCVQSLEDKLHELFVLL